MHNVFGSSLSVIFPNIFKAWPTTNFLDARCFIPDQINLALGSLDPLAYVGNSLLNFFYPTSLFLKFLFFLSNHKITFTIEIV